ncbi:MAG: DUF3808 domain-containing protein, partial [Gammaproteobacteria bacterium]|nr:DUF3808 domain-containing protein [Gammaproteobacteria bacterium]
MLAGSIFNKIGQIFVLCTLLTSYSAVVAPSELINTVDQSLRGGNPQHALDLINEALNKSPNDYTLRFHKSRALSQLGNSDEAARLLVQLENEESRPEVLNNLSWIYAANGDYKHAQASLQQALKLDPRFATIYTNLNNIYAALASEAYQKALGEKDKQVPKPHLSLITELSLLEKETAPRVVEATPPRPLPSTVPLSAQER